MKTRRIEMFAYDGANSVDISGPLEVFATAARLLSDSGAHPNAYEVELI